MPSWHTVPVTRIAHQWNSVYSGARVSNVRLQKEMVHNPDCTGPESKEMLQAVWKCSVAGVLTAASRSWTCQSTHTKENRKQKDTPKLNVLNGSREPQATFVLYPRAVRGTALPRPSQPGWLRLPCLSHHLLS